MMNAAERFFLRNECHWNSASNHERITFHNFQRTLSDSGAQGSRNPLFSFKAPECSTSASSLPPTQRSRAGARGPDPMRAASVGSARWGQDDQCLSVWWLGVGLGTRTARCEDPRCQLQSAHLRWETHDGWFSKGGLLWDKQILVVGWPTHLKNMKVSWDDYSQCMEK